MQVGGQHATAGCVDPVWHQLAANGDVPMTVRAMKGGAVDFLILIPRQLLTCYLRERRASSRRNAVAIIQPPAASRDGAG